MAFTLVRGKSGLVSAINLAMFPSVVAMTSGNCSVIAATSGNSARVFRDSYQLLPLFVHTGVLPLDREP